MRAWPAAGAVRLRAACMRACAPARVCAHHGGPGQLARGVPARCVRGLQPVQCGCVRRARVHVHLLVSAPTMEVLGNSLEVRLHGVCVWQPVQCACV